MLSGRPPRLVVILGSLTITYSGYFSPRSAPEVAPANTSMATNGMVVYKHGTNEIVNITDSQDIYGYTHGALHHIIPENGSEGMLLNLMALQGPLQTNFTENDKNGPMRPVSVVMCLSQS